MQNLTSLRIGRHGGKTLLFGFAFHKILEAILALPKPEMRLVLVYIVVIIVTRR
jgi:hypothetical protein